MVDRLADLLVAISSHSAHGGAPSMTKTIRKFISPTKNVEFCGFWGGYLRFVKVCLTIIVSERAYLGNTKSEALFLLRDTIFMLHVVFSPMTQSFSHADYYYARINTGSDGHVIALAAFFIGNSL